MFKRIESLFNTRPNYAVPGPVRFVLYTLWLFGWFMIALVVLLMARVVLKLVFGL